MKTQLKPLGILGEPWVGKQHHWNTGAKENHQMKSGEPRNRHKTYGPDHLMNIFFKSGPSQSLNLDPLACNYSGQP